MVLKKRVKRPRFPNGCLKVRFPLKRIFNTNLRSKLDESDAPTKKFRKSKGKRTQYKYLKIALFASLTLVGGIVIGSYYHAPIRRTITLIGVSFKDKFLKTFSENSDSNPVIESSNSSTSKNSSFGSKNGLKMIFVLIIGAATFLIFKNAQIEPVPVEIESPSWNWRDFLEECTSPAIRVIVGTLLCFAGSGVLIVGRAEGNSGSIGSGLLVTGWQLATQNTNKT